MEIKDLKKNDVPEQISLQELTKGCTTAIVTYAIKQNYGSNDLKQAKMIVLFDKTDFDFDLVEVGVREMMMRQGTMSLLRSFVYFVKNGFWKRSIVFGITLYRNILGFKPNDEIDDCRKKYKKYHLLGKGGIL